MRRFATLRVGACAVYARKSLELCLRAQRCRSVAKKRYGAIWNCCVRKTDGRPIWCSAIRISCHILSFLDLGAAYSERDLEAALVREMEKFILELGQGFAFIERQKRMIIDGKDFHLDLLFYHRKLRLLVAVELKTGEFEAGFKGQMELYLRWLDKHERGEGEGAPIGLLLCAKAGAEQLELLQIGQDDIHVAEYLTQHLPAALLEQKLREAQQRSLAQIAGRENADDDLT